MNKTIAFVRFYWFCLALLVLMVDYFTKKWIILYFRVRESISITSFINIICIYNHGIAFSFLSDLGKKQHWILSVMTIIISMILFFLMYQSSKSSIFINTAYAFIIGGAFGNFLDRVIHGIVIDFIDFHIETWHWPTFNIADISICIGTLFIIIDGFCFYIKEIVSNK